MLRIQTNPREFPQEFQDTPKARAEKYWEHITRIQYELELTLAGAGWGAAALNTPIAITPRDTSVLISHILSRLQCRQQNESISGLGLLLRLRYDQVVN